MTEQPARKPRKTIAALEEQIVEQGRSITRLKIQLEDRGWQLVGNDYSVNGLDLQTIKTVAEDLRTHITGGGMMKRITEIRGDIIYGDGVGFADFAKAKSAFTSANNIDKLFSVEALLEINRAHCTDGQIVLLVHKRTKDIVRFGVDDLVSLYVDMQDKERVWYVKRRFQRITAKAPEGETVERYYVADTCPAAKAGRKQITESGTKVIVDQDYVAVIWDVNRQVGWTLGVPDLLPALQWVEQYTAYLKGQARFAEALAMIAWQYKAQTTDQAKRMAATVSDKEAGQTAVATAGMDLIPMKGNSDVSFENGEPLAAQAAAAGEVPVDSLLAKSATAAATSLDPDVKRMAKARQQSATTFFKRIGKLLGAPNLRVIWPDLESESPFRESQMIVAAWGTGMFEADELRTALAARLRIELEEGSKAPTDVYPPNTKRALKMAADVAPKPDPTAPSAPAGKKPKGKGTVNKQGDDALGVGKLSDGDNTARDKGE